MEPLQIADLIRQFTYYVLLYEFVVNLILRADAPPRPANELEEGDEFEGVLEVESDGSFEVPEVPEDEDD